MHLSNPALATADAYVPGLTPEYVAEKYGIPASEVAKLGSAENPFGPSPNIRKRLTGVLTDMTNAVRS